MSCVLCGETTLRQIPHSTLRVRECISCGLQWLVDPDPVSYQGWSTAPAERARKCQDDDWRRAQWLKHDITNRWVLDYGCGTGGFVEEASHYAAEAHGFEVDETLRSFLRENGVPLADGFASRCYDVITMFHVLEHLPDPVYTLRNLARGLVDGGKLVVEVPNVDDALLTLYGCEAFRERYYMPSHLFYFNTHTLRLAAEKAGLKVDYIQQVQRYPVSNHLHWLAKGEPDGHRVWGQLNHDELISAYEMALAAQGRCDTILARFTKCGE